jgi:hypothetical protein
LVARFKGQSKNKKSRRAHLKRRLQHFGDFVRDTVLDWQSEERELAERELTRFLELIRDGVGDDSERTVLHDRTGHRSGRPIFTICRTATLHPPKNP